MLFQFLAMIPQFDPSGGTGGGGGGGGGGSEPPVPTVTNANLTHFAGVCNNHVMTVNASVTINWTSTNFNSALHEVRIYQDGVLIRTQSNTLAYLKQIAGVVEDGCGASWQSSWVFRVDIVRKSDSVVLASMEAQGNINNQWVWYYGTCC